MEFTVEQAKTIFDLIRSASPYAYPLFISLLLPFIWVLLKKLLGLSATKTTPEVSDNFFDKLRSRLNSTFTFKGNLSEIFLFYLCVLLFVFGGILLKIGEKEEEKIRQGALGIKQYFTLWGYTYEHIQTLKECKIPEKLIDAIVYNYPDEFIRVGDYIYLRDSVAIQKIYNFSFPLLESYLNYSFKFRKKIYLDSIAFNPKNKNYNHAEDAWNIFDYFDYYIVLKFIGLPVNKGKYSIDEINGQIIIMKNDS